MRKLVWLIPALLILIGLYVMWLVFAPVLRIPLIEAPVDVALRVDTSKPTTDTNRLYIPKINVDVEIVEGNDEKALERGAWHRKPENGNPVEGGNFVLSAHRFSMGWTPAQTRAASPFYSIDQLAIGDKLVVDFKGSRYTYVVNRLYDVPPTAGEIESRSSSPKLTLYSCDLSGRVRVVVEALPVATN